MCWVIKKLSFQKQTNKIQVSLSSASSSRSDLTWSSAQCGFWRWLPLNQWLRKTLAQCFHHREPASAETGPPCLLVAAISAPQLLRTVSWVVGLFIQNLCCSCIITYWLVDACKLGAFCCLCMLNSDQCFYERIEQKISFKTFGMWFWF